MQYTQFCAESAKNDHKSMDFLKRNFYFKMEGVANKVEMVPQAGVLKKHINLKHSRPTIRGDCNVFESSCAPLEYEI
jgi:hypothetical protein